MFNNVGKILKTLSVVVFWLGSFVSMFWGLYVGLDESRFLGLLIIFGGPLFSWLLALEMYGFGQLIENTDKLVAQRSEATSEAESAVNPAHSWRCDGCGNLISVNPCPHCGRTSDKE